MGYISCSCTPLLSPVPLMPLSSDCHIFHSHGKGDHGHLFHLFPCTLWHAEERSLLPPMREGIYQQIQLLQEAPVVAVGLGWGSDLLPEIHWRLGERDQGNQGRLAWVSDLLLIVFHIYAGTFWHSYTMKLEAASREYTNLKVSLLLPDPWQGVPLHKFPWEQSDWQELPISYTLFLKLQ